MRAVVASGAARRVALVARTAADVRDVLIEGESGILACCPAHERPVWEPSKRRLTWPSGAIATTYSAEEPDQLRGPQHDAAWCDELAAWRYPDAWDQLQMGLRLGSDPRVVVTTTPRPTPIVRALASSPTTRITRGRTADNARNLAPGVVAALTARYGATRLGRQELDGASRGLACELYLGLAGRGRAAHRTGTVDDDAKRGILASLVLFQVERDR